MSTMHENSLCDAFQDVHSRHSWNADGDTTCCRMLIEEGVIDCIACLESECQSVISSLPTREQEVSRSVLKVVTTAGSTGIKKCDLVGSIDATTEEIYLAIIRLTNSTTPILYWVGYSSLVLVSATFTKNWTVAISESPLTRVLPRRWLDVEGLKVADFWEAALHALIGVIVFRPGITQAELRWRVRSVYDKQEMNEALSHLYKEGFIEVRGEYSTIWTRYWGLIPMDEAEEKGVYLFISPEKHWYQV